MFLCGPAESNRSHCSLLQTTEACTHVECSRNINHHHHHHHHHHIYLNREGRWGTTGNFTTSFLHFFFLFSIALWDLPNSRPVHSLTLSSLLFLCLSCLLPLSLCHARWLWPDLMNGNKNRLHKTCIIVYRNSESEVYLQLINFLTSGKFVQSTCWKKKKLLSVKMSELNIEIYLLFDFLTWYFLMLPLLCPKLEASFSLVV